MKLAPEEISWVKDRMQVYVIKYQEIYDEVLDHILTAIEERRQSGDKSDIQSLFQNVVDDHFNGYVGIEALADNEEKLFKKKIGKLFYTRLKQYFNWKSLSVSLVLLGIASQVPNVTVVNKVFIGAIFFLAMTPVLVTFILLYGKVETIKGKRSLLKSYLFPQTLIPVTLFNGFIYWPVLVGMITGQDENYKPIKHLPPVAMMGILVFFLLVNLSYIESSRQLIDEKLNRF